MNAFRFSLVSIFATLVARAAAAQCPSWTGPFGIGGMDWPVLALAEFDDGSGPALYAAGQFTHAYGVDASYIARWDGAQWSAVGGGFDDYVYALQVYDDGNGRALYAGGEFTQAGGAPAKGIAKWNGTAWSPVGGGIDDASGFSIRALAVFDNGGGQELYATGHFRSLGGIDNFGMGSWNGASWNYVGGGIGDYNTGYALEVFNDGSGPALYVGGFFDHAGQVTTRGIARWNAQGWSAVGGGIGDVDEPQTVKALQRFDDGSGPSLAVGGDFDVVSGVTAHKLARWNGANWSALGPQVYSGYAGVRALEVFDDGSGPHLYAAGALVPQRTGLTRWNGANWDTLDSGAAGQPSTTDGGYALAQFDDGGGLALFVGGWFNNANGITEQNLARWRGGAFSALGTNAPLNNVVRALVSFDAPGVGPRLIAGGGFQIETPSGMASRIAQWNGTSWEPLAAGFATGLGAGVMALAKYDDGSGEAVYVGGFFTQAGGVPANSIARWNGSAWSALGSGVNGAVNGLTTFDDGFGPKLIAVGNFTSAGGTPALGVASWNGSSWSPLGSGIVFGSILGQVYCAASFDDGSGPALYIGGFFDHAGGVLTRYIAKWNGSSWSSIGAAGFNNMVYALTVFDDGPGPALYAGGPFTDAAGTTVSCLARWNGTVWSDVGGGVNTAVYSLHGYDGGAGPSLFVGGLFWKAGGQPAGRIARWDGSSWDTLDGGVNHTLPVYVYAMETYDDGSTPWPQLFAGGQFNTAGGMSSWNIARWSDACVGQGVNYCTAGTTASGCTALMSSTGNASLSRASGFVVQATTVEAQRSGVLYFGTSGPIALPYGTGTSFRCVAAPVVRTGIQSSGGNAGLCDGVFSLDFNAWMNAHALAAPTAGATAYLQAWFRDPGNSGNIPASFSNALRFVVAP